MQNVAALPVVGQFVGAIAISHATTCTNFSQSKSWKCAVNSCSNFTTIACYPEVKINSGSIQNKFSVFRREVWRRRDFILFEQTHDQPIRILLSSFHVGETNSILVGLSFGLGPADIQMLFKMFKSFKRCASFKTLHIGQFKSSILQTGPARTTTLKRVAEPHGTAVVSSGPK